LRAFAFAVSAASGHICCLLLSGQVIKALKHYEAQKKAGKDPEFHAEEIEPDPKKLSFRE